MKPIRGSPTKCVSMIPVNLTGWTLAITCDPFTREWLGIGAILGIPEKSGGGRSGCQGFDPSLPKSAQHGGTLNIVRLSKRFLLVRVARSTIQGFQRVRLTP